MNSKRLFAKSLAAGGDRLHVAAHSHHLWPDASFDGQVRCWEDAARLADRKWDVIMGEVWPEAQAGVAAELGTGDPSAIVFSAVLGVMVFGDRNPAAGWIGMAIVIGSGALATWLAQRRSRPKDPTTPLPVEPR